MAPHCLSPMEGTAVNPYSTQQTSLPSLNAVNSRVWMHRCVLCCFAVGGEGVAMLKNGGWARRLTVPHTTPQDDGSAFVLFLVHVGISIAWDEFPFLALSCVLGDVKGDGSLSCRKFLHWCLAVDEVLLWVMLLCVGNSGNMDRCSMILVLSASWSLSCDGNSLAMVTSE